MRDFKNDVLNAPLEKQVTRAYAGQLLWAVFDDTLSPADAIRQYPTEAIPSDPSLDAAYQALWHYESDERWQQSEVYYLDAQLTLLKVMAQTLLAGHDFPPQLCEAYPRQGKIRKHTEKQFWRNSWRWPWHTLKQQLLEGKKRCTAMFALMRRILGRYKGSP